MSVSSLLSVLKRHELQDVSYILLNTIPFLLIFICLHVVLHSVNNKEKKKRERGKDKLI